MTSTGGHAAADTAGVLDEAYERLHQTGPEFEGWLSNHGPMAVEAMARHGHRDRVHPWLDDYVRRLEDFPRGTGPIGTDWPEAMGDPRRIADWTVYFRHQTGDQPWRDVLGTWWPRLLPGVTASATHGVIRVGHAVRSLLTDGESPAHVAELAHALAYWAARWQPVPGCGTQHWLTPRGTSQPAALPTLATLAAVPRIPDQSGGIRTRLPQLTGLTGWPTTLTPPSAQQAPTWLAALAHTAVTSYLSYGHGSPVMLVHAATAPTAILRTLPALDEVLWVPSATAAWHAAATIMSVYAPAQPAPQETQPAAATGPQAAEEIVARAVSHGDEHAIKFADTAAEVHTRTADPATLAAAARAIQLIPRPG